MAENATVKNYRREHLSKCMKMFLVLMTMMIADYKDSDEINKQVAFICIMYAQNIDQFYFKSRELKEETLIFIYRC